MKVYVVSGQTESGDDYLYVWLKRPTKEQIKAIGWPEEMEAGTMNLPDEAKEVETEDGA